MKKIIIIVLSFILLLGISYFVFFFNHSKSKDVSDNNEVEINNVNEKIEISEPLDENDVLEQEIVINKKEEENKSNNKEQKEESNNNSVDTKKDTVIKESPKVESKKESTKEEPKEEVIVDKVVIEEVKEMTAWEELGITEYDYYNKPMWSWARIDFSIKDYKTYENTREACITKGEEYFKEGLGYSCTGINSYSGDYLGEMLKTF